MIRNIYNIICWLYFLQKVVSLKKVNEVNLNLTALVKFTQKIYFSVLNKNIEVNLLA